jgi:site-specific DNA-methyltransferase (adenine-specific)
LAVSTLVDLKRKIYGTATRGKVDSGFTLEDAAAIIGKTKGSVIEDLALAEAVKMFPNLAECKTKSEIKSAVKGLQRVSDNIDALKKYEETIKKSDEFVLVNRDAVDWLKGLGDKSIDLFFTDPPYGIDIHDNAMTTGGKTGGNITTTGITYDDSESNAKSLLERLTIESYRITKDTGHALIFCAPSHFTWLSERMAAAGWLVAPRPIVWIKRESGQNNQPEKWFSAAYEFILFARKTDSRLAVQGRPDWIQCDLVLPSVRVHQAEKPVMLCKELIARTCMPGNYMVDPCMGSGALVDAAVQMKVLALGCEKDISSYANAVARMTKKGQ